MKTHDTRDLRAPATALLAVVLALTACTPRASVPTPSATPSPTASPAPVAPTPTPTETTDPEAAAATAAVLEAYTGYWDAKVAAFANPAAPEAPELTHFAVDTALADVRASVFSLNTNGIAVVGEPALQPEVIELTPDQPQSATVIDCVDVSRWQPVFTDTGESAAPPDQSLRVLTTSTAYVYDGRWTIRSSVVDRDATC